MDQTITIKNESDDNIEDDECQSCRELKDEVARLKDKYESTVKDENLPEYLWNRRLTVKECYLPVRSRRKKPYKDEKIKETLKNRDELEKALNFIKSMVDLIDNKEEVFGIFHRCPEKLMIMPGLEVGWFKEPNAS
eukprot:gene18376-20227_t